MSVYRRVRGGVESPIYSYEFEYDGRRYRGSTNQITPKAAEAFERREKDRVRQGLAGLLVLKPSQSPRIQDFAPRYLDIKAEKLRDMTSRKKVLIGALKYFGAKPRPDSTVRIDPKAPYNDLRLGDVAADPKILDNFERWMKATGIGPSRRNHFRSVMSDMYRVASRPALRLETGVTWNPFAGVEREPTPRRHVAANPAELRKWIKHAPYHCALALAIGALAPKLRLRNILDLQWSQVNFKKRMLRIDAHKTVGHTGKPLVVAMSSGLEELLKRARKRQPKNATYVVTYRGEPVTSIIDGVRAAAKAAKIPYGLKKNGVTFHSLRNTAATLMKRSKIPADDRQHAMGHTTLAMTQSYEVLDVDDERPAMEALALALPLTEDVMAAPPRLLSAKKKKKRA